MTRNLLLSGGTGHPFEQTSALLADVIGAAGIESDVQDDLVAGIGRLERPGAYAMVTVNALRWRMLAERYAPLRPANALSLPEASRALLQAFVGGGGSLLAVHTACICFDDWPGWGDIVGAAWDWDRSCHPPLGPVHVTVRGGAHPLVDGVTDFDTVDEAYGFLDERDDVEPLATAAHGGRDHPLLWARRYGRGRVVYSGLGHDERSYRHPSYRRILAQAVAWLAPGGAPPAAGAPEGSGRRPQPAGRGRT